MNAKEAMVTNASYHADLLATIASLANVKAERQRQAVHVKDLKWQLAAGKVSIREFAEQTKNARKEHEAVRNSTARRFAALLKGNRETKESEKEWEYVEALEREMKERESQNEINKLLDEARTKMADLVDKQTLYESAKTALQVLYHSIFDGPTEDFPEEDRIEDALNAAIRRHEDLEKQVKSERRAAELLERAAVCMGSCHGYVQEALRQPQMPPEQTQGEGSMTEHHALNNARGCVAQSERFVDKARRASRVVKPIKRVYIAEGSTTGDILFDNIFPEIAVYSKAPPSPLLITRVDHKSTNPAVQTKQMLADVSIHIQQLAEERDAAHQRANEARHDLVEVASSANALRKALYEFRRATFESFVAQIPPAGPPPGYDDVGSTGRDPP
ncbi:hypothetical protein NLJ89_g767 [Agrocybe chaxingu]|uniref:Uncharacterized protein n=1 Tax=Agrocybe chaxingu TaxID=84603 RepID=A0A9W8N160_9AGAR|nr:hypothetical protein NLJ89_g767 [Agrocybe chaxingu]